MEFHFTLYQLCDMSGRAGSMYHLIAPGIIYDSSSHLLKAEKETESALVMVQLICAWNSMEETVCYTDQTSPYVLA